MIESHCAICGQDSVADVLYPERLPPGAASAERLSARRPPDQVHPRILRCRSCGLIYANPILEPEELTTLYRKSRFTYEEEIPNLRSSYGHNLRRLGKLLEAKDRFLEVGCGNGFMLEEAMAQGYHEVFGVEPSRDAIAKASPQVRGRIFQGMFEADRFDPASFNVICAFQVFDHLPDPNAFLAGARRLLQPGGVLFLILHNSDAWSAKFLGKLSPIFDIAHPYLYDRRTLSSLLARHGFTVRENFPVWNTYSLRYWMHLTPVPSFLKRPIQWILGQAGIGRVPLTIPAGNFGVIAQHPTGGGVANPPAVERFRKTS